MPRISRDDQFIPQVLRDALSYALPMSSSESKYGKIAVTAATKAASGLDAQIAWESTAAAALPNSPTSANKSCPKGAFLGLAYAGEIRGVPPDARRPPGLNGGYALLALGILRGKPSAAADPTSLWQAVMDQGGISKKHNSQMHVVAALWNEQLFRGQQPCVP